MIPRIFLPLLLLGGLPAGRAADPQWRHLSTATGDLPLPGASTEQTGAVVGDLDGDGKNDFVISFRKAAPALVWYRRTATGWDRYVIEPEFLTVEAGGALLDIDGDGDLDLVFGGDWQSDEVWWWENPAPKFDPTVPWKRHVIKQGGARQHHDQIFGDFLGTGRPQLAFWNQKAKKLFLAEIPANPRAATAWPLTEIFSGAAGEGHQTEFQYAEGVAAADVDGDGRLDLLAGNLWFKHRGGTKFDAIQIGSIGGRIVAAKFKPGKYPQVVIAPGDGIGPLRFYECTGNPEHPADWHGRDLAGRDLIHGHSLQVADIDGDGHLDIFAAEMAQWTGGSAANNPGATAWIFYGDGQGNFRQTVFQAGMDFHEARVADLDGDGRMDILSKPYTWMAPRLDVWLQLPPGTAAPAPPAGKTGLELYSFRRELAADLPGTLARARAMGFTEVEVPNNLYGRTAEQFRGELDRAGLKCSSMIADYGDLATKLDEVIATAKTLGASFVVNSWIPHQGSLTAADVDAAVKDYNAWGARLHAAGLQFCYHIHGYEFQPAPEGTLFDRLLKGTTPENLKIEIDVFWVIHPGQDPVALMRKYPGRYALMHLKDLRKGIQGDLSGHAPGEASVPLGQGQADWPAILRLAANLGLSHYYIEDEAPNAIKQVPESLRYLAAQGL